MSLTESQENRIAELYRTEVNNITYSIIKEENHVKIVSEIAKKMTQGFVTQGLSFIGELTDEHIKKMESFIYEGVLEIGGKVDYFTPTEGFSMRIIMSVSGLLLNIIEISEENKNLN